MPKLQDIKDGKVKIGKNTSLHYNGQIYRGEKEINKLVETVLPSKDTPETSLTRESTGNAKATDSAPAAGKSTTTSGK